MSAGGVTVQMPALDSIDERLARIERMLPALALLVAEIADAQARHFTVDEAATRLRISRATAWRMIKRGELHAQRFGGRTRIAAADLRRASDAHVSELAAGARR